jgi:hypothetical protein
VNIRQALEKQKNYTSKMLLSLSSEEKKDITLGLLALIVSKEHALKLKKLIEYLENKLNIQISDLHGNNIIINRKRQVCLFDLF